MYTNTFGLKYSKMNNFNLRFLYKFELVTNLSCCQNLQLKYQNSIDCNPVLYFLYL